MGDWYRWDGPDLLLMLKLQTRSSRDAFLGPQHNRMRVCITAPPVDGKANRHLVTWLAREFRIARSAVTIENGHSIPLKRVRIEKPLRIPESSSIHRTD